MLLLLKQETLKKRIIEFKKAISLKNNINEQFF